VDAVACTALKAGHLKQAQKMMKQALRLARATPGSSTTRQDRAGRQASRGSPKYLQRALDLSPGFDPLQPPIARRTLGELQKKAASPPPAPGTTRSKARSVRTISKRNSRGVGTRFPRPVAPSYIYAIVWKLRLAGDELSLLHRAYHSRKSF